MDIADISKVASRKRMNNDAEKLREKVSRETAKIIKLKVAQDTAYWDLKEKLQQLEANHERLQQNMVEVQMQHEAISGRHQEELRLRPDTLNKLSGTRHICDALEEYGERLRRGVARCRADQRALQAAYGACGARVRVLGADAARARELRLERAAAGRRLARALERLGAAGARADALDAQRRELHERLERAAAELRRREQEAAALQADAARLLRECSAQCAELRRVVTAKDSECQRERARVEEALTAQHAAESREATAKQQRDTARRRLQRLDAERAETAATLEQLKAEVATLANDKKRMETVIDETNQIVAAREAELRLAGERLAHAEAGWRAARQDADAHAAAADEHARRARALQRAADEAQAAAAAQREADARHADEMRARAAERERELDDKARTIARLMADLKAEAEARARADAVLAAARRQHDAERAELGASLARLEAAARAKDDEIGAQLAVILDMRADSERLAERVRAKQATIDNIQKELTGRAPPPPPPAERERDAAPPLSGFLNDAAPPLSGFLSDGSADADAPPLRALRPQGPVSLSQVKKDLKMKSRTFFKNKRLESKIKKFQE